MARRSIVLSNGGLGGMSLPLFDLPFGWKSFIQRGAGYRVPDEKIFSSDTGGQDSRTIQQRKFTIYFASKKSIIQNRNASNFFLNIICYQILELMFDVCTLFYGGHLVLKGVISGGQLVSFILYSMELGNSLSVRQISRF